MSYWGEMQWNEDGSPKVLDFEKKFLLHLN
jgi:hypothetical protein